MKKDDWIPEMTMELDEDLTLLSNYYHRQIRAFIYGIKLVVLTGIAVMSIHTSFISEETSSSTTLGEWGSYIGGVTAPFMAIAGFLMLYIALINQQNQVVYQFQAIRNQSKQFKLQIFDNSFFNLLNHYKDFVAAYKIEVKLDLLTIEGYKNQLDNWQTFFGQDLEIGEGSATNIPPNELKEWFFNQFYHHQGHIKKLFKPLISILFFINEENIEIKKKYLKILEYQVSESEKFILFYFFITYKDKLFTEEEKLIIPQFLQRTDAKTLILDKLYNPVIVTTNPVILTTLFFRVFSYRFNGG